MPPKKSTPKKSTPTPKPIEPIVEVKPKIKIESKKSTTLEELVKYNFIDIKPYFVDNLFPHDKKILSILNHPYPLLTYDLLYVLFENVYKYIEIEDSDIEFGFFTRVMDGDVEFKRVYIDFRDFMDERNYNNPNYETLRREHYDKLFKMEERLDQKLQNTYIYKTNEKKALEIVRFNHKVITDMNFGNNNFFNKEKEKQNFVELIQCYDKDTKLYKKLQMNLLKNSDTGTFKRLHKYYYFLMYYFQKKLTIQPINQYYQIMFLNLFRKLNYKISILISKILDYNISNYLNNIVVNYELLKTRHRNFKEIIYGKTPTSKDADYLQINGIIPFAKYLVKQKSKGLDVDKMKVIEMFENLYKDFINTIVGEEDTEKIIKQFIQSYNSLINIIEPNEITNTDVYNRFIRVFNKFDKDIRNISEVNETSVLGGGKNNLEASGSTTKSFKNISLEEALVKKEIRNKNSYSRFYTPEDLTKTLLNGSQFYYDNVRLIEEIKQWDDIIITNNQEKEYEKLDKIIVRGSKERKKLVDIEIGKLTLTFPKYISISDERYKIIIDSIDNIFDLNLDFKIQGEKPMIQSKNVIISKFDFEGKILSIFDFTIYRFKKFLLKIVSYFIKFVLSVLKLFNETIMDEAKLYKLKKENIEELQIEMRENYFISDKKPTNEIYDDILVQIFMRTILPIFTMSKEKNVRSNFYSYNEICNNIMYKSVRYRMDIDYNNNYNFSKLMNELNYYRNTLFSINFIERNVFNKQNNVEIQLTQYIEFLIINSDRIQQLKSKSVNSLLNLNRETQINRKIVRLNEKDDINELVEDILNVEILMNNNSTTLTINELVKIQNNCYNYFYHLLKTNKLNLNYQKLNQNFYQSLFIVLQKHLHDEFIYNICIPIVFICLFEISKSDPPMIINGRIHIENLFFELRKNLNYEKIDNFVFILEKDVINVFLFILYTEVLFNNVNTCGNTCGKNKIDFDSNLLKQFYKYLFKGNTLTRLQIEANVEFIPWDIFTQRYYLYDRVEPVMEQVVEQVAEQVVEQVITPVVAPIIEPVIEIIVEPTMAKIIEPVIERVVEPIMRNKIVTPIEVTKINDPYLFLKDEKTNINELSRSIINNWKIVSSKDIIREENERNKNAKLLLNRFTNVIKRIQIYKNKTISRLINEKFKDIYTFLYSRDIHYTILKYSIKDITKYYTCGAYTHITLKICQEKMPIGTISIFDGLLSQIYIGLSVSEKSSISYITFHYGLSNLKNEVNGMIPNCWITILLNKKKKSFTINLEYLYLNYPSYIEFINNLYSLFIEYTKENEMNYYYEPSCMKKESEMRFIENIEIM